MVQAQVTGVDFAKIPKEVMTSDKIYQGKTVIVATGAMGRKPSIKGEAEYVGKGVSYCAACDAPFFKEKVVAVVGDPEKVIDELGAILKFAEKIYVVTWKKQLPLEYADFLERNPKIRVLLDHRVVEIFGSSVVEGIHVKEGTGKEETLELSGVFVYLSGNQPIIDFLDDTVELSEEGCVKVDLDDMSTSVEGAYVVGDVTCKQVRQSVIAAAEGCKAALAVEQYLNRRERVRPHWL
jgi:thioredoxin reductase (NADPH)